MSNFTISNSTMSSNSACRLFNNMICVLRSENTISLNIKVSSISYHLLLCLKEVVVWYWYNCRNVIAIDHTELISIFIFNSWQISQCEPNHYASCIMFHKNISMIQSMHKVFLNFFLHAITLGEGQCACAKSYASCCFTERKKNAFVFIYRTHDLGFKRMC